MSETVARPIAGAGVERRPVRGDLDQGEGGGVGGRHRSSVERARRRFLCGLLAVAVVAPAVLAAARAPRWWEWIAPEQTPMTWLQSVVLVLACAACVLLSLLSDLSREPAVQRRTWLVLAGGFAALALDERFAVHERIRDGVLAPRGVTVPFLPWVAPGDFLVLGIALCGLALLPSMWRAVAVDPAARRHLVAGVLLALVAVGMDSIDPSTWTIGAERVQQTVEEIFEMAAGLCLLAAVGLRLLGHLSSLVPAEPRPSEDRPGTAPTTH